MIYIHISCLSKLFFTESVTMMKYIWVLLSLILTGEAADSLESVVNSVRLRASVVQTGNDRNLLPSRARDLSVEIPPGARRVGKSSSEYPLIRPNCFAF